MRNRTSIKQVMFHANDDGHTVVYWSEDQKKWCVQDCDGVIRQETNLIFALIALAFNTRDKLLHLAPNKWTVSLTD